MPRLEDYRGIAGTDTVEELHLLAGHFKGKSVLHVNSTAVGGGVAEILSWMVPLLRELGVDARWEVFKGGEEFYAATSISHIPILRRGPFSGRTFSSTTPASSPHHPSRRACPFPRP